MKINLAKTSPFLLVIIQTVIAYFLLIIPAEYLLTEHFLILTYITPQTKTIIFLTLFFLIFLANFLWPRVKKTSQKHWILLLATFLVLLLVNQAYSTFYDRLQETPKIYSISSDWSIVGMQITIKGKNFGPAWQSGQVNVGSMTFQIKDWSEDEIIIIQPQPTGYFTDQLCVTKYDGRVSNCLPFMVRDPGELHQKY